MAQISGIPSQEKKNKKLSDGAIEDAAINMVERQKGAWETGSVFVTERVSFQTRDLIRTLKKNYWGIFDTPLDPMTGRKKTWVPMTESTVESAVKNIDLDTKDINLRAKSPGAVGMMHVIRSIVKNNLDAIFFGKYLDQMERDIAIMGTAIWKTIEVKDKYNKPTFKIVPVDLLNFYIDPTAEDVQNSDCIERAVLTRQEFEAMSGWDYKDEAVFSNNLSRNDERLRSSQADTQTDLVEVFEWWGDMPLSWSTKKKKDEDEYVPGHIVVSGLNVGAPVVHLIEKNDHKEGLKPYQEFHYTKVQGRWLGRGVAEKIMQLQIWMNAIVNIRINRSFVTQLGIFKIRKGSGITPQMVSRLASNGAITVQNMQDIEQFIMQDASQASYADENTINDMAQRVTSLFDATTGETLPASTSATSAVIQQRGAASQFTFIKKGIGIALQEWLKCHVFPIIQKRIKPDEVVRVTDDLEKIKEIDDRVVKHMVFNELQKLHEDGRTITPILAVELENKFREELATAGKERWVKINDKVNLTDYDVQVYITNEEIDKAVLVTNLSQVLQIIANVPGVGVDPADVVRQIFDVLGLEPPRAKTSFGPLEQASAPEGAQVEEVVSPAPQGSVGPLPTPQQAQTAATTLASELAPTVL